MVASPPAIADAFHVLVGDVAGIKYCLSLRDPLCPGPCDQDPVRHLRKRKAKWVASAKAFEGLNARYMRTAHDWSSSFLGARAFARQVARQARERQVVLWTTPTLPERLSFWWMLDALRNADFDRKRCWVVDVRVSGQPTAQIRHLSPDRLVGIYPKVIAPFSALKRESGLWQKFASRSPMAFDRARRTMSGLAKVAEPYGLFFPRARPRSSLRLSEYDQELFDSFTNREWRRPVDLFDRRWVEKLFPFGDLTILERLREWAKHGRNPAIEKRREKDAINEMTAVSLRLTPVGERIRDKGLQSMDEAPPMFVGGCQVYSAAEPWVKRNRGRSWHIERASVTAS